MKKILLRGLAVVGGLIVLAIVVLVAAGQRDSAGRNVAVVDIDRPPAIVFPFFVDLNVFKGWVGWTEVSLDSPGELRVGSKFRVVVVNEGSRVEMDGEITALEPNRLVGLVLKSTKPPFKFTENAQFKLEEHSPGKTRVEMQTSTEYEGILALMEPLISGMAQERLDADVARLKVLAEK